MSRNNNMPFSRMGAFLFTQSSITCIVKQHFDAKNFLLTVYLDKLLGGKGRKGKGKRREGEGKGWISEECIPCLNKEGIEEK